MTIRGVAWLLFPMLLVVSGPVLADSWNQAGYDPARTGDVPGEGPEWPDVAFEVELPGGGRGGFWSPAVWGDTAYVPVEGIEEGHDLTGVARVDLEAVTVEAFVDAGDRHQEGLAVDEEHLYTVTLAEADTFAGMTMQARDRLDGSLVWEWEAPEPLYDPADQQWDSWGWCDRPALTEDTIYVSCFHELWIYDEDGTLFMAPETESFIAAIDASTGEASWVRTTEDLGDTGQGQVRSIGLWGTTSVIGDHVFVTGFSERWGGSGTWIDGDPYGVSTDQGEQILFAFDAETGDLAWRHSVENGVTSVYSGGSGEAIAGDAWLPSSTWATGEPGRVYVRLVDQMLAVNPSQGGEVIWSEHVGGHDVASANPWARPAFAGSSLFLPTVDTLYSFDTELEANDWRMNLDPAWSETFYQGDPILAGDRLYVVARGEDDQTSSVYALDQELGEILWRYEILAREGSEARHTQVFWNENLVLVGEDATFRVIGKTAASLEPAIEASTVYPETGREVQVDLSSTKPGIHGEATRFRADWGDGTETDWQEVPVLTHAYAEEGDTTARFIVGNDANQTASTTQAFHVGVTEPNWISERFEPKNQDMTFGVLGILVALTGGVIGVGHRYQKRSRLQKELDAIDRLYEETRGRPAECEVQLTERKVHARGLLSDGTLAEEQFQVVENRIEDLQRGLRRNTLDEEFGYLPHSLVLKAHEMLEDGKVTTLEAEAFLAALEQVEGLSDTQRAAVRKRIEDWYGRDAGGAA